jgi:hypothetical protein
MPIAASNSAANPKNINQLHGQPSSSQRIGEALLHHYGANNGSAVSKDLSAVASSNGRTS